MMELSEFLLTIIMKHVSAPKKDITNEIIKI
jgi:hypothetical protein